MTDKDRNQTPPSNAPSWVDEVLSSSSAPASSAARRPPAPPQPQSHQTSGNWDHWPQTDAARDLRLPEDPPRPAPAVADARPFDSDDWVARATGGQVRNPPVPVRSAPGPQSDAWGEPLKQPQSSNLRLPPLEDVGQKKLIAGLLAIFLGSLGVHKFFLGMNTPGLWMLLLTLVFPTLTIIFTFMTFGLGFMTLFLGAAAPSLMALVGLIEGIIYLTKSDEDFQREYLVGKKPWF